MLWEIAGTNMFIKKGKGRKGYESKICVKKTKFNIVHLSISAAIKAGIFKVQYWEANTSTVCVKFAYDTARVNFEDSCMTFCFRLPSFYYV